MQSVVGQPIAVDLTLRAYLGAYFVLPSLRSPLFTCSILNFIFPQQKRRSIFNCKVVMADQLNLVYRQKNVRRCSR